MFWIEKIPYYSLIAIGNFGTIFFQEYVTMNTAKRS